MIPEIDRDAMHPERALPPYSGALLGALCKAFDLDDEEVVGNDPAVGGKYTIPDILNKETTTDYFRGKRPIKPASELEILEAVGRGLIRSGIVPQLRLSKELVAKSPDDPVEKFVLLGLQHFLEAWDGVRGGVSSMSASVLDERLATLPFLRLFAIDVSIRVSALLLLAGIDLPLFDSLQWAKEQGRGWLLRQWLHRAGHKAPTQTELATKLTGQGREASSKAEASSQAVGYWLAGAKSPSVEHQIELATVFAGFIENASRAGLLAEMRRFYSLWRLCNVLADVVGWKTVEDVADRICRYITEGQAYIRKSGDPSEPGLQQCLVGDLWMGIWKPGGEHGNASLTGFMGDKARMRGPWTRLEQNPVWKTDLYVCGKTAKLLSGHEGVAMWYGIERRLLPFVERIQHCLQRAAGWEAMLKAMPELATAALQPPFDRESTFNLMNSYHRLWPEELRGPWERLSSFHPLLLANHYEQLASDEQVWGFYEEAIEFWKLAVHNAPADAYKVFRLGALYGEMGEVEKAGDCLQRASDLAPTWPQPALEFGRVLLHVGQPQRALDHLLQLPHDGTNAHVFGQYLLGHAFAAIGRFREAAEAFCRLTELQTDDDHQAGNAGAYADASLCLLRALRADPKASDQRELASRGKKLAKAADLRGDDRALKAWEIEGRGS